MTPLAQLLEYVEHKDNCDFLQPMWHKGPCDCGLFALFEKFERREPPSIHADVTVAGFESGIAAEITASPAFQRWKNLGEHER